MPASRGIMTRAASALLFAATLGFSLAFPGSAAESPEGVAPPRPVAGAAAAAVSNTVAAEAAELLGAAEWGRIMAAQDRLSVSGGVARERLFGGKADILGPLIHPDLDYLDSEKTMVRGTAENCVRLGGETLPASSILSEVEQYCVGIGTKAGFCILSPVEGNVNGSLFKCAGEGGLYDKVLECNRNNFQAQSKSRCEAMACEAGSTARGSMCLVLDESGQVADVLTEGIVLSLTYDADGLIEDTAENCVRLGGETLPASSILSEVQQYCVGIGTKAGFCILSPVEGNVNGSLFKCAGEGGLYEKVLECNRDNFQAQSKSRCESERCPGGRRAHGARCVPVLDTGPPLPPPPPDCVGACGENALFFNANPPGGTLSVHDESGNEIMSRDLVREQTLLTLTAEPANESWYVTGWTGCPNKGQTGSAGDAAAVKRCLLHMPGGLHTVSVSFAAVAGRVLYERFVSGVLGGNLVVVGQLSASSGGEAVANGDLLDVGTTLTMEATPQDDFYVESWSGPCAGIGETGTAEDADRVKECVLTVFGGMRMIGVNFASKPRETVDPTTKDDSVTIAVINPDPDNPPDGVLTMTLTGPTDIVVGRTIIIEATPDDGMCVSEWTGACGGGVGETGCIGEEDERKKCVLVVTPGLDLDEINPVYIPSPNLFRVSHRAEGMGTVFAYSEQAVPVPGDLVSGGAVMASARVSFLAVPAPGYYVAGWSGVCAGAHIGNKESPGPTAGSRSCHWVADRDATGSDEVLARFASATPLLPYTNNDVDAALPENRTATRGAVAGYEGVILTVTTRDGSSLDFVPAVSGGLAVDARGVVRSQGPVNGLLLGEFTAVLSRADRESREVELNVRISVVRPPAPPDAIVKLEGAGVSGSALERPFGYANGGAFTLLAGTPFTVDMNTGEITGNPPAGTYAVSAEFTHPGFAGTITQTVEIRIVTIEDGIPAAQLNPGLIYLASGFPSNQEFYRMEPDGSDVKITDLYVLNSRGSTRASNNGVNARIENDGKRVVFEQGSRTSSTDVKGGDFRFTEESIASGDVLRAEEPGNVRAQGLGPTSSRHVVTEGMSGARAGDYLLAVELPENRRANPDIPAFTDVTVAHIAGSTEQLTLAGPYGTDLYARTDLTAGRNYVLTMTVQSRNGEFLGDQPFVLTVSVKRQDSVPLLLADAIGLASPVVYAAPDYVGAGYSVSLGANLEFYSDPALISGQNDFSVEQGDRVGGRRVSFTSHLLRELGDETRTARVRVPIRCVAPKRCPSLNQVMNIAYRPAPNPAQPLGTIPAGEAIERTALAPAGFEGGVFEELTVAYENPTDADLFTVSAEGVISGGIQPVGTYKIPVGYSTPDAEAAEGAGGFLGTVRLTVTVKVVERDIPLEEGLDMALLRPGVFAVAPDYQDVLLTMTLRGSTVNLTQAQGNVDVFQWEQSDREVLLRLGSPLNASGLRGARLTLEESVSSKLQNPAGGGFADGAGGDGDNQVGGGAGVHFGFSLSVKPGGGLVRS